MSVQIHNVRFYDLKPRAIVCFAYEPEKKKLALARDDNTLELWNVAHAPFLESTICGADSIDSIEGILWVGSRLFTCGLRGMITEYDSVMLGVKEENALTGGAAWCMDINPNKSRIAVGTEEGYINTFFVTEDSLMYERIFDKQKGRILCLKWDLTGGMIFTGSQDSIRVWNATSGHAIHKMIVPRKERKETIVWCLEVTNENMIVSGDSRGTLSIYDPNKGVLVEYHDSHIADILAITMTSDKNIIYCAGVDPVIRTFQKVTTKSLGKAQWVRGIERRVHIHDVRALTIIDNKLYSGGVDGYLGQSSYPPKTLVKHPPLLQHPSAHACPKSRCIMLKYANYLQIWKLGRATLENGSVNPGTIHQLRENPVNILQLKTKDEENIVSCAITKDSKLIIYSTQNTTRVFNFDVIDNSVQIMKQESDVPNKKVDKMIFSSDDKLFITCSNDGKRNIVSIYSVNNENYLFFKTSFTTENENVKTVGHVSLSSDNKYLIISDVDSHIVVYNLEKYLHSGSLEKWSLPQYSCVVTAMAVQKDTNNLVIVYSDQKILEYSIPRRKFTDFSNNLQGRLPNQWLARHFPITHIIFDENNDNVIIFHDSTTVFVVNKVSDLPNANAKIPKLESLDKEESTGSNPNSKHALQVVKKYKHLAHLDWMSDTELVAVELNHNSLTEKLPPTLKKKQFGT
ncbi:U3 small nucleolar RNA-associated protein 4 homolog [Trichogramma pretiosum]|uniref:U3 small nucleolar RNA-associated protein 4 homolog n=1 Tax=Trichogramma pretiosum TaxID=7493 RepID=UPI0006C9E5A4|nr:U3 small nucleolar RNA-associated protein 4 homolog [Trichogramma pretiosum]